MPCNWPTTSMTFSGAGLLFQLVISTPASEVTTLLELSKFTMQVAWWSESTVCVMQNVFLNILWQPPYLLERRTITAISVQVSLNSRNRRMQVAQLQYCMHHHLPKITKELLATTPSSTNTIEVALSSIWKDGDRWREIDAGRLYGYVYTLHLNKGNELNHLTCSRK